MTTGNHTSFPVIHPCLRCALSPPIPSSSYKRLSPVVTHREFVSRCWPKRVMAPPGDDPVMTSQNELWLPCYHITLHVEVQTSVPTVAGAVTTPTARFPVLGKLPSV